MSSLEKHYTIKEIAQQWGFSIRKVRAIFRDRSDVLRVGHGATLHKKCYVNIRVPESTVSRVYAELQTKGRAR
jgi:hypothetical protein